MTQRTRDLILASALAARPECREKLQLHLKALKEKGAPSRMELYEAFLQFYLFAGFPAALEAERMLLKLWGPHSGEYDIKDFFDVEKFVKRGDELYNMVYAVKSTTVKKELVKISPERAAWALVEGYGKTLSREGLDVKTRELCIVGILTQLELERQLFSHLLGARNIGASLEEIAEAVRIGSLGMKENNKLRNNSGEN